MAMSEELRREFEKVYRLAIGKLPDEVGEVINEAPFSQRPTVDRGFTIIVNLNGRTLPIEIEFFESITNALSPDIDTTSISSQQLGLPTVAVKCLGYGCLASHSLSDFDDFASDVAEDIVRQVTFAKSLLR